MLTCAHNASHRTFPVQVPHGALESDCKIKLNFKREGRRVHVDWFHRDETCRCSPLHEIRSVINFCRQIKGEK